MKSMSLRDLDVFLKRMLTNDNSVGSYRDVVHPVPTFDWKMEQPTNNKFKCFG